MLEASKWFLPLAGQASGQTIYRCPLEPTLLTTGSLALLPNTLLQASRQRQTEFLAGRKAALAALQAAGYTGVDFPGVGLQREPLWPAGYCGSITHHRQQALAVAAPISATVRNMGLDLESLMTDDIARDIADELLTTSTERQLATSGLLPYATLMTLIFSAKESLFKTLFYQVREMKPFAAASLIEFSLQSGHQPATFTLILNEYWGPLPAGTQLQGSWQLQQDQLLTLIRV